VATKEGLLKWQPREKIDALPLPKILVNGVEIDGLDSVGEYQVLVGDRVKIIMMKAEKP